MNKYLALIAFVFVLSSCKTETNKVNGYVTYYNHSFRTIILVNTPVSLWDGNNKQKYATYTDSVGYFEFNAVKNGTYKLYAQTIDSTYGTIEGSDLIEVKLNGHDQVGVTIEIQY